MYIIYMRTNTINILLPLFLGLLIISGQLFAQTNQQLQNLIEQQPSISIPKLPQNPSQIKIARLHYSGGGDWYWGRSAIPNMLKFARDNSDRPIDTLEQEIRLTDPELYNYPFLFATGHGVIKFEFDELEILREYLLAGGFLFVNDSYGIAETFLEQMKKIFPEREIVDIPFDHPLYHCFYDFPNGPPKIHEHDNKSPRGYGLIVNGRIVVYFLVESDIGDGWEDPQVHNDPDEKRLQALQMGMNLLTYSLLY